MNEKKFTCLCLLERGCHSSKPILLYCITRAIVVVLIVQLEETWFNILEQIHDPKRFPASITFSLISLWRQLILFLQSTLFPSHFTRYRSENWILFCAYCSCCINCYWFCEYFFFFIETEFHVTQAAFELSLYQIIALLSWYPMCSPSPKNWDCMPGSPYLRKWDLDMRTLFLFNKFVFTFKFSFVNGLFLILCLFISLCLSFSFFSIPPSEILCLTLSPSSIFLSVKLPPFCPFTLREGGK